MVRRTSVFNVITMRRLLGLLIPGLLLVSTTGCNKMLAKYSLSQAQKRYEQAREHRADVFTKEQLQKASDEINAAQSQYNSNDFRSARTTAKSAADQTKELLQQAKVANARDLKEDASRWLDRARANQAQTEDAKLY